jgi:hypothetical protein
MKTPNAQSPIELADQFTRLFDAGDIYTLIDLARIHVVNDIAVYSNIATVKGIKPDGSDLVAPTIEVARRQTDWAWKYLIDDPGFVSFLA